LSRTKLTLTDHLTGDQNKNFYYENMITNAREHLCGVSANLSQLKACNQASARPEDVPLVVDLVPRPQFDRPLDFSRNKSGPGAEKSVPFKKRFRAPVYPEPELRKMFGDRASDYFPELKDEKDFIFDEVRLVDEPPSVDTAPDFRDSDWADAMFLEKAGTSDQSHTPMNISFVDITSAIEFPILERCLLVDDNWGGVKQYPRNLDFKGTATFPSLFSEGEGTLNHEYGKLRVHILETYIQRTHSAKAKSRWTENMIPVPQNFFFFSWEYPELFWSNKIEGLFANIELMRAHLAPYFGNYTRSADDLAILELFQAHATFPFSNCVALILANALYTVRLGNWSAIEAIRFVSDYISQHNLKGFMYKQWTPVPHTQSLVSQIADFGALLDFNIGKFQNVKRVVTPIFCVAFCAYNLTAGFKSLGKFYCSMQMARLLLDVTTLYSSEQVSQFYNRVWEATSFRFKTEFKAASDIDEIAHQFEMVKGREKAPPVDLFANLFLDDVNKKLLSFEEEANISDQTETQAGETLITLGKSLLGFVAFDTIMAEFNIIPKWLWAYRKFLVFKDNGMSFVEVIMKFLTRILHTLYDCFRKGSLSPLFVETFDPSEWLDQAEYLMSPSSILGGDVAQFNKYMTKPSVKKFIERQLPLQLWIIKATEHYSCGTRVSKNDAFKDGSVLIVPTMLNALNRLRDKIESKIAILKNASARPQPLGVMLQGKPGIGKSTIVTSLNEIAASVLGRPFSPEQIYVRKPENYWTGINENTISVTYDDPDQKVAKPAYADATFADELIQLINVTPFCPEQAAVEEKGKNFVSPVVVHYTTNTLPSKTNLNDKIKDPYAFGRRFPLVVLMSLNEGYSKPDETVDEKKICDKTYSYNIGSFTPQMEFESKVIITSRTQFLRYYTIFLHDWVLTQQAKLAPAASLEPSPVCKSCKMLVKFHEDSLCEFKVREIEHEQFEIDYADFVRNNRQRFSTVGFKRLKNLMTSYDEDFGFVRVFLLGTPGMDDKFNRRFEMEKFNQILIRTAGLEKPQLSMLESFECEETYIFLKAKLQAMIANKTIGKVKNFKEFYEYLLPVSTLRNQASSFSSNVIKEKLPLANFLACFSLVTVCAYVVLGFTGVLVMSTLTSLLVGWLLHGTFLESVLDSLPTPTSVFGHLFFTKLVNLFIRKDVIFRVVKMRLERDQYRALNLFGPCIAAIVAALGMKVLYDYWTNGEEDGYKPVPTTGRFVPLDPNADCLDGTFIPKKWFSEEAQTEIFGLTKDKKGLDTQEGPHVKQKYVPVPASQAVGDDFSKMIFINQNAWNPHRTPPPMNANPHPLETIYAAINKSVIRINCRGQSIFGLRLKGHKFIFPAHVLTHSEKLTRNDDDFCKFDSFEIKAYLPDGNFLEAKTLDSTNCVKLKDQDLVIADIPEFCVLNRSEIYGFLYVSNLSSDRLINSQMCNYIPDTKTITVCEGKSTFTVSPFHGERVLITSTQKTVNGQCGLPLIGLVNDHWFIVGIHVARDTLNDRSLQENISRELVTSVLNRTQSVLDVNDDFCLLSGLICKLDKRPSEHPASIHSDIALLKAFPERSSVLNYMTRPSNCVFSQFLGSIPEYHQMKFKSDLQAVPEILMIKDLAKEFGVATDFGIATPKVVIPEDGDLHGYSDTYLMNMLEASNTFFRGEHIDWAIEDYTAPFAEILKGTARNLTFDEALHGTDHIVGVNLNTSAGPPYNTAKTMCQMERVDEFTINVNPVLVESVAEVEAVLDTPGQIPVFPFTTTLKDEIVSEKKLKIGEVRNFQVATTLQTQMFKMHFGKLFDILTENKYLSEVLIGFNATCPVQVSDLVDFFSRVGPITRKSALDGDYRKYDQKHAVDAMFTAIKVTLIFCKMMGFSDEEIDKKRRLLLSICFTIRIIKGEVVFCVGTLPSGCFLTAWFNCILNSIYFRSAYYCIMGKEYVTLHEFRSRVKLMLMGDDNTGNVHDDLIKLFTCKRIAVIFSRFGQVYTPADKKSELSDELKPLTECTILKRGFRKADPLVEHMHWAMPLELKSIFKSTMYTGKSVISREECQAQTLFSARRELFFHGPEVFEAVWPRLKLCGPPIKEYTYEEVRDSVTLNRVLLLREQANEVSPVTEVQGIVEDLFDYCRRKRQQSTLSEKKLVVISDDNARNVCPSGQTVSCWWLDGVRAQMEISENFDEMFPPMWTYGDVRYQLNKLYGSYDFKEVEVSEETKTQSTVGELEPVGPVDTPVETHPISVKDPIATTPEQQNDDYFQRRFMIRRQNLVNTDTEYTLLGTFDPMQMYFSLGTISNRTSFYTFWRGTFELEVVYNGPPTAYGGYVVSVWPYGTNEPGFNKAFSLDFRQCLQTTHWYVDPSTATNFKFVMPFTSLLDASPFTAGAKNYSSWRVQVFCLDSLKDTAGASVASTLTFYGRFQKDFKMGGLTSQGLISDYLSWFAGGITAVSSLGMAVGEAVSGLSAAAGALGFTRHPSLNPEGQVVRRLNGDMQCVDGIDTVSLPVSYLHNNYVDKSPPSFGDDLMADVSFSSIFKREGFIIKAPWLSTAAFNTVLVCIPVTPMLYSNSGLSSQLAPMGYFGTLFQYWVGDINFHLKFCAGKFHAGAVNVFWSPTFLNLGSVLVNEPLGYVPSCRYDLQNGRELKVTVPWNNVYPALSVYPMVANQTPSANIMQPNNGFLVVSVISPLVLGGSGSTSAQIILSCSSDNLIYHKPRSVTEPWTDLTQPWKLFHPQGLDDKEEFIENCSLGTQPPPEGLKDLYGSTLLSADALVQKYSALFNYGFLYKAQIVGGHTLKWSIPFYGTTCSTASAISNLTNSIYSGTGFGTLDPNELTMDISQYTGCCFLGTRGSTLVKLMFYRAKASDVVPVSLNVTTYEGPKSTDTSTPLDWSNNNGMSDNSFSNNPWINFFPLRGENSALEVAIPYDSAYHYFQNNQGGKFGTQGKWVQFEIRFGEFAAVGDCARIAAFTAGGPDCHLVRFLWCPRFPIFPAPALTARELYPSELEEGEVFAYTNPEIL